MSLRSAVAVAALLAAAATSALDLPPPPRPEEGYGALWDWLLTVNGELSIPDPEFRLMFGGFSLPMLLLFEIVGMRKDWKLWPFLVPFWLIFGSIGLGVLAGVGLTAAHIVLFPAGRIFFILRNRRRAAAEGARAEPARAERGRAEGVRAEVPAGEPPRAPRGLREALAMVRELAEKARDAAARERQAKEQRAPADRLHAPPPAPPAAAPDRPVVLPPGVPGQPDFGRFKPDLSRFRRPSRKG